MREKEFEVFMSGSKSQKGWLSYARTLERKLECNLDVEFNKDQMKAIEQKARQLGLKQASVFARYREFCFAHPPNAPAAQQQQNPQPQLPLQPPQAQQQQQNPQHQQPQNNFWDPANFCRNDGINQRIWHDSPAVQATINAIYNPLQNPYVGAQQSMIQQNPQMNLPWVPDLVGKNWEDEDSILICGSAYAPFIAPYSAAYQYPQIDYINHYINTPNDYWPFQQEFLGPYVVLSAGTYYKRIAALMTAAGITNAEKICLFDLCRASFVQQGQGNPRQDIGGDQIVRNNCPTYTEYIDSPGHHNLAKNWTWERIITSKSRRIIALGTIAERGLIKLFIQNGANLIYTHNNHQIQIDIPNYQQWLNNHTHNWVAYYAGNLQTTNHGNLNLGYWRNNQNFWVINCAGRKWHLLPNLHPAAWNFVGNIPNYVPIINQM